MEYDMEIQRGMAWLDDVRPGWLERISLDRLTMQSGYDCVLGQVFEKEAEASDCGNKSGFDWASEEFDILGVKPGYEGCCGADDLGFCAQEAWRFSGLTAGWKEALRARQEDQVPA